MEAETAVTKLQTADQDYTRCLIARNIELLYKQNNNNENHNTQKSHAEMRTINNIKIKLSSNNAVVIKADKGNTVVICYTNGYYTKAQEFILNNQFSNKDNDPTNIFQKK